MVLIPGGPKLYRVFTAYPLVGKVFSANLEHSLGKSAAIYPAFLRQLLELAEIFAGGLHNYLTEVQEMCRSIGEEITRAYLYYAVAS